MIQDFLLQTRLRIGGWLMDAGIENPIVQLERTSDPQFGEYASNAAMRYARQFGKNPLAVAEELVKMLHAADLPGLERAEFVKPGFVNLYLTTEAKIAHVRSINEAGADFGKNNHYSEERWVIEHTSPNPNKAMHLGHLRNNLVGMGIVRLLHASGAEVTADCVYNDRGIAIAKVMYGFLAHMKRDVLAATDAMYWFEHQDQWYTPESRAQKPDLFVTECYVKAEADMAHPETDAYVRQLVVDWEAGNPSVRALWETVLTFAYAGIDRTLSRLGSHWDKVWYEHEHYQKGKQYVAEGVQKGVFVETDDGAVVTQLEADYRIPDTVVLKRDGTSLYITQDLALTDLKKRTYDADKLVWVVGPEQSLAFQQLFAVCEQLGIGAREDFAHVTYGYVGLKDAQGAFQKMSSRAGTVVLIDDVIDQVKDVIRTRLNEDAQRSDEESEQLSEVLALAAVKFAFLRSDRTQDLSFDVEQSVDVHGDSGMYVMYAYVRTQSILRKAPSATTVVTPDELGEEAAVVRTLLYYPAVIEKATADLSVHHVAQYLLELSSEFNRWYARETFLDGGEHEAYRLQIVQAVGQTLSNGLKMLGIETIEQI